MAGHYRKRGKESYELIYRDKRKTIKATNDREAELSLATFIVEVEKGKFRKAATLTVKQFIEERWIRDYINVHLAPGTAHLYKVYLNNRIIPALGHLKLDKVKPADLLDFYSSLKESGIREDKKLGPLSPATVKKYHHIISSMFRCAIEWQFIDDNPASRVKSGKLSKKRPFSLDEEQSAIFLNALANEPLKYRVLGILAIFTGLRRGELLGLTWANIDCEQNILRVEQTSQHISGIGIYQKDPKTESSKRIVPIPTSLIPLLEKHRTAQIEQQRKYGDK
jgi:integrase